MAISQRSGTWMTLAATANWNNNGIIAKTPLLQLCIIRVWHETSSTIWAESLTQFNPVSNRHFAKASSC
ncbi:hypothetical protein NXC24_PB00158 (plasmid) [Rhizobium sp. NXC24]|nr:hypothetical protein NXC24_PB00158 [Rhizobium sp. NXC24]